MGEIGGLDDQPETLPRCRNQTVNDWLLVNMNVAKEVQLQNS